MKEPTELSKKMFFNYKIWEEMQVLRLYQKEQVKMKKVETNLSAKKF